jgi:hypothetical protein
MTSPGLFFGAALAADGYALLADYGGDAGLGDAVARADLVRRFPDSYLCTISATSSAVRKRCERGGGPWLRNRRGRIGDP